LPFAHSPAGAQTDATAFGSKAAEQFPLAQSLASSQVPVPVAASAKQVDPSQWNAAAQRVSSSVAQSSKQVEVAVLQAPPGKWSWQSESVTQQKLPLAQQT
jgi:hypothetical protein